MRLWWDLPGPRGFLDSVVGDLRQGRHPILLLPEHGPQSHGLEAALAAHWREHGSIEPISVTRDMEPIVLLARHYELSSSSYRRMTAQALAQDATFSGRVLRLTDIDADSWPLWRSFLEEYEHCARNVRLSQRTLFIVPLVGDMTTQVRIRESPGFAIRQWQDRVTETDMLQFAFHLLRHRREPLSTINLLASTISQAALFDPEVAIRLAELQTSSILEPSETLTDLARERGWKPETPAAWENGTSMRVSERERAHSCLKVLSGTLSRRLWRAQVSVLFLVIEEHRQRLIDVLGPQLTIPFPTHYGVINDLRDLEISHIANQIDRLGIALPYEVRHFIRRLKTLRDRLAHLEPGEASLIADVLSFPEIDGTQTLRDD